jgi:hypothetical protein
MDEKRWLRVVSLGENVFRSIEANLSQVAAKHFVGAPEQLPASLESLAQIPSHADGLTALTGKK